MSLEQAFTLANDSEFRTLVSFGGPPRAGRVLALEGSGQVRVEMDDPDGGDVLAWPLNGAVYAVEDIVYCLFAANSPDSAIVLGAKGSVPSIRSVRVIAGGRVGIGTDQPVGGLHVLDGPAGVLSPWSHAAVDETTVVILPAGSVERRIGFIYVVECGGASASAFATLTRTTALDVVAGSGTFRFWVGSGGGFQVWRHAGTGAGRVAVFALWM